MKKFIARSLAVVLAVLLVFSMFPVSASASSGSNKEQLDRPTAPPVSQKKETSTTTTTPKKAALPANFGFKSSEVSAMYKGYSGRFMVSPIADNANLIAAFAALEDKVEEFKWDANEAAKGIEGGFLVVYRQGTRRVYSLLGKNRIQVGDQFYNVPAETYTQLLNIYKTDYKKANYAQWLIHMIPGNITAVTYDIGKGAQTVSNKEALAQIIPLLRSLRVTEGTSYTPLKEGFKAGNGNSIVTIKFGEQNTYTLMFEGNNMFIEAGGLHIGIKHTVVKADVTSLLGKLQNPVAVPAVSPIVDDGANEPAVTSDVLLPALTTAG